MKIFEDELKIIIVSNQLLENNTYYIDFESENSDEITDELKRSKLKSFVNWQTGNRFASITITNFIGNIFFFGNTYDIKSSKFLTELSGADQFQTLLNDIQHLSKNVIFSYSSPSFVIREVDFTDIQPSLLLIFNYYKQIILQWGHTKNLESSFLHIIHNSNFKYEHTYKMEHIHKIKKVNRKTISSLAKDSKYYIKLDESKKHLLSLPITNFISKNSEENYFPIKTLIKKNT